MLRERRNEVLKLEAIERHALVSDANPNLFLVLSDGKAKYTQHVYRCKNRKKQVSAVMSVIS